MKIETGFLNRILVFDDQEYRYQVYVPREFQRSTKWPVILALHGGGEYGSDGIRQTAVGLASAIRRFPDRVPAIVVFPQAHVNGEPGWQGTAGLVALAALDKAIAEFSGDSSRVYLTGYSAGGNGSWYLASRYPTRFAAVAVVCGFISEFHGQNSGIFYPSLVSLSEGDPFASFAKQVAHLPIWIFHGEVDPKVSVEESRRMFAALRALDSDVQYTEFQGVKHDAWNAAYDDEKLLEWMFKQRR
ncbi:prolyl oligopeptidase family serine peptidase [Leptolyngbya sp. PL-A3]|uniref:carboxylesterase family protein n=1 Tax=Leptolyngbya sp. PL-A3 TaxID=2933911 RepID=UPI003299DE70